MLIHVLSGQWPFPDGAVLVNPQNPRDLVPVSEFDRRANYIKIVGKEHPLLTLIETCLSNSPSYRPTASDIHHQISVVAADHPPSFANKMEVLEIIKGLKEKTVIMKVENEEMRRERDNAIAEKNIAVTEKERLSAKLENITVTTEIQKRINMEKDVTALEDEELKAEMDILVIDENGSESGCGTTSPPDTATDGLAPVVK